MTSWNVWAARLAIVDANEAEVRETPGPSGNVIEKLKKGTPVAASNLPLEGFHKIRTESGLVGWVSADVLELHEPPTPEAMAKSGAPVEVDPSEAPLNQTEKKDPWASKSRTAKPKNTRKVVRIRGLGGIDLFQLTGVVNNFDSFGQGYHYGGEVVVNLSDLFGIVLRGEKISKSSLLTDTTTNNSYTVNVSSIPLYLGPEFSLLGSAFSIHFGLLGGFASATTLSSQITEGSNVGSSVSVSASHLALLGRVNFNWQFSKVFSLFMEAGYRYTVTPTFNPDTTVGAAGEILKSSFSLNLSGPVISSGVSVGF